MIQHLAECFADDGDEVHVITTDALSPTGFRTRREERADASTLEERRGVVVHRLPTHWWLSAACRPLQAAATRLRLPGAERAGDLFIGPVMRGLHRLLDDLAPAGVYASAFPYLHMHQLVEWGARRTVPVVLHGAIHPDDRWAFRRSSIRRSCVRAAGYAANTAYEGRYVTELGVPSERITVVGAGVELDALTAAARNQQRGSNERPRILFLGHLTARKGLDTVVETLPAIWSRHPDVEVVVAGKKTNEAEGLRRVAFEASRGRDLRWLPDVSDEEKASLLASASMVLYPSRAESFGIVFLEAWAFGVPVVGCRAGAVPDVVADGVTGLLIPPGDAEALFRSVTRLLDDAAQARRMGAEGQRRVREAHTWSAVAQRARQALEAASARVRNAAV